MTTCSYYNDELQKHGFSSNIVCKTWMQSFLKYNEIGFQIPPESASLTTGSVLNNTVVDWRYYIKSMIIRDPIDIRVITTPQKGMFPDGSAMRMQYYQNIEPRKIGSIGILHFIIVATIK